MEVFSCNKRVFIMIMANRNTRHGCVSHIYNALYYYFYFFFLLLTVILFFAFSLKFNAMLPYVMAVLKHLTSN